MDETLAQSLVALSLAVRLSLPVLGAAFLATLGMAVLSGVTRLQEPALSALPRALVTLLALSAAGGYIARELSTYTHALFRALPELVR
jgi:flagellar biosynthesis protein FliQ